LSREPEECRGVLTTGIDYLRSTVLTKGRLHKVLAPIMKVYSDVANIVRASMVSTS